ncbi:hypothetical protein [Microvirga makkahensis]|uniref:Uncharacterized protein n=1 Tax=Microvirga makkahensis TaxID=1128670 RepID=A0A7X3MSS9_9HYPH|nr:hypothetical protein [Microvirga makkahensis]MXQ12340.1 hypothetical protein [Microvirga makkahensis]
MNPLTSADIFFRGSQVYDPVALLRQGDETLYLARVGRKASRQFMILTPTGEPAWPHEPLGSLSDAAWALRAHAWHLVTPEPIGESTQQAKTLARLLTERT